MDIDSLVHTKRECKYEWYNRKTSPGFSEEVSIVLGGHAGDFFKDFAEIKGTFKSQMVGYLINFQVGLFEQFLGFIYFLGRDVFADSYMHVLFKELA